MRRFTHEWIGWTAVCVVAVDWLTKLWIRNRLALGEAVSLARGWIQLVHSRNEGVAFSLLAGIPGPWKVPALAGLAGLAILALSRIARSAATPGARFAVALMIGGAAGNLGDRVADGGVTDFLVVRYFPYIFNVADAAITTGGLVLALALAWPARRATGDPA